MTGEQLIVELRSTLNVGMSLPGSGKTALRHRQLMEIGRESLSLARLAEAHWDAIAILAETGRLPESGAIYGVWASEVPGQALRFTPSEGCLEVSGSKRFCTVARLIDHALLSVGEPDAQLIDVDLRQNTDTISFDRSEWITNAFEETQT